MTTTAHHFLREICNHPDDDAPRLIYADWLEENGSPDQAKFIRVQCRLAHLPRYDPLWVHCLYQNRDWLSGRKLETQPPALPSSLLRWEAFPYRRGFPWRLRALDLPAFLGHAPSLFSLAPIQALDVDGRSRPDLASLAASPWLERLTTLEFRLGEFGGEPIRQLLESPHAVRLTEFSFAFGGIVADGLPPLLNSILMRRTRKLKLDSNFFTSHGRPLGEAFGAVKELPCLETLTLIGNRIGPDVVRPILEKAAMPRLSRLDLQDNPLGPAGVAALAGLSNLTGLTSLNLSKTAPGLEGVRSLAGSSKLENLRALHLASNRLGPVAVRSLLNSPQLSELRLLDLTDNPLKDNGVKALVGSSSVKNLVSLHLHGTDVSDVGVKAVLESPHLNNLIHLALDFHRASEPLQRALQERFANRVRLLV